MKSRTPKYIKSQKKMGFFAVLAIGFLSCGNSEPTYPSNSHWKQENLPSSLRYGPNEIWGPDMNNFWAGGSNGFVLHYDGIDRSWSQVTSFPVGLGRFVGGIWGTSTTDVWVVTNLGAIYHLDSTQWSEVASGTKNSLNAVWGTAANDVWAVGAARTILHYEGTQWQPVSLTLPFDPTTTNFLDVFGFAKNDVFVVGGTLQVPVIVHYDGNNWSVVPTTIPDGVVLEKIWGTSASKLWALGRIPNSTSEGSFFSKSFYFDGTLWQEIQNQYSGMSRGDSLSDMWGTDENNLWVAGCSDANEKLTGLIGKYDPTSKKWNFLESVPGCLFSIWGANGIPIWAGGTLAGLYKYAP